MPEPVTISPITSSLAALVATQRFTGTGERRWQEEEARGRVRVARICFTKAWRYDAISIDHNAAQG